MVTILQGDAGDLAAGLEAGSVNCVVTSPPYWGLRDYGVPGQLGLEATPAEYVEKLVAIFDGVRRALRDDGTLWLNLGDSYNAYNGNAGPSSGFSAGSAADTERPKLKSGHGLWTKGLKPKDLVGIPWRVAFALQADGWWLRSDIIWSKPNPMPESVTDRPTKAHEYVFLLAKSERYYFDADAIREKMAPASESRYGYAFGGAKSEALVEANKTGVGQRTRIVGAREYGGKNATTGPQDSARRMSVATKSARDNGAEHDNPFGPGRNARSVWTISTEPFPEAHFATFPTELARRCILAGCPRGGVVLDPFAGAGTTGLVADRLGRNFVGFELNPEYAEMAKRRIRNDAPLFAEVNG